MSPSCPARKLRPFRAINLPCFRDPAASPFVILSCVFRAAVLREAAPCSPYALNPPVCVRAAVLHEGMPCFPYALTPICVFCFFLSAEERPRSSPTSSCPRLPQATSWTCRSMRFIRYEIRRVLSGTELDAVSSLSEVWIWLFSLLFVVSFVSRCGLLCLCVDLASLSTVWI